MSDQTFAWDRPAEDRLIALWAGGMKTKAIADELGISKNAVIGKVHRLGLPERGSSILPAWSEEQNARFRRAWHDGVPVAEIAKEFGISKGWAETKRRRLKLPPRGPGGRLPLEGQTLPPIAAPTAAPAPVMRVREMAPTPSPAKSTAPAPRRPAPPVKPVAPAEPIRSPAPAPLPCCWPIGEPGTAAFRFCDGKAAAGKPYCAEHCAVAFVPATRRQEHQRQSGVARSGADRWV